jgi:hypothetical protein
MKKIKKIIGLLGESAFEAEDFTDKRDGVIDYETKEKQKIHIFVRASRITVGFTLVTLGMLAGLLPILPGYPLIIIGLGILSLDFYWAHKVRVALLKKMSGNEEGKVPKNRKVIFSIVGIIFLSISLTFSYIAFIK